MHGRDAMASAFRHNECTGMQGATSAIGALRTDDCVQGLATLYGKIPIGPSVWHLPLLAWLLGTISSARTSHSQMVIQATMSAVRILLGRLPALSKNLPTGNRTTNLFIGGRLH